ncbi:MAG: peptide deformylase [Tissierellia bacterium]|nr:peptide deformylase [Tissierellia bacterium]
MALRNIRIDGDPILRKRSREVKEINQRILDLIEDMKDTMYDAEGVGLAAPQVGILRRVVVIDIGEGPIIMINPEIKDQNGVQIEIEACLSVPDFSGTVKRPRQLSVEFLNEDGEKVVLDAEDLLARAVCHEIDHLDGILFKDKYIKEYIKKGDKFVEGSERIE